MFPSPVASREVGKVYRLVSGTTGRLLAVVMDTLDGEVRLYDVPSLEPRGTLLLGASRTVRGCALGPGDTDLAVLTHDDATLFRVASGHVAWSGPLAGDEAGVAFAPDGLRIAMAAAPQMVVIASIADGAVVARVQVEGSEPTALVWDRHGIAALGTHELVFIDPTQEARRSVRVGPEGAEAVELVTIDDSTVAVAGNSRDGPWLELRRRVDGAVVRPLSLEGDHQTEGLAFSGGVLFVATEGGTYRADPPFDQLVQWLPPLGGAHDPTRLAAVEDSHVAVSARDLRVFRTRS
jgi:hypothetical protein